ncbi:AMP-dependent synthetase ligase protein [Rutstroemia sp. NJR-2017a WRK4]|nr:AMP-dependent synthetase ligase protein [Rutstroemia sp. NJR-2017a WRK4]
MPKRQGVFELVPETLAKPTAAPSRMTSKQAKRAWQKAQRTPRVTKEEQRRRDAEELKRHREEHKKYLKEREKEKAAAKAKAAREKKAAKELAEKEERRRKGLPEPSKHVRPSQPRISMFVKGVKRGWETDSVAEDSEGTMCDDSEEMQHPAKRVALDDSEDEFGDFPMLSNNDITLLENSSMRSTPSIRENSGRAGSVTFSRSMSRNASPIDDEQELPQLNHLERHDRSQEFVQKLKDQVDSQLLSEAVDEVNRTQEKVVRPTERQSQDCNQGATDSAGGHSPTHSSLEHRDSQSPVSTSEAHAGTNTHPVLTSVPSIPEPLRAGQSESPEAQSTSQVQAKQHRRITHDAASSSIYTHKQSIDGYAEVSKTPPDVKPITAPLAKALPRFNGGPKFDRIGHTKHEKSRIPLKEQSLNSPVANARSSASKIPHANSPLFSHGENISTRQSAFRTPQNNASVSRPSRPQTPRSIGPPSLPPKFKPHVPLPVPPRNRPPQTRPQFHPPRNNPNLPPSSTQAFIESHIDFFPSPTQEARELSEDICSPPRLSHAQKTRPTPVPVSHRRSNSIEDEFSMISTQDLMSSQEMREIATSCLPAKVKDSEPNDGKVSKAEKNSSGKEEDGKKSGDASFMDFSDLINSQDSFFSSQEFDDSTPVPVPAIAPPARSPAQTGKLPPAKSPSPPPPSSQHPTPNIKPPSHIPTKKPTPSPSKVTPNPPQPRRKPYFQEKPEDHPPTTIPTTTHTTTTTTSRKARFFIEKEEDMVAAALTESKLFAPFGSTPNPKNDSREQNTNTAVGRRARFFVEKEEDMLAAALAESEAFAAGGLGRVDLGYGGRWSGGREAGGDGGGLGKGRGEEGVRDKEKEKEQGRDRRAKRTLERVVSAASTDYGDLDFEGIVGEWGWD